MSNYSNKEIKEVQKVKDYQHHQLLQTKVKLEQRNKEAAREHLLRMQCLLTRMSTK